MVKNERTARREAEVKAAMVAELEKIGSKSALLSTLACLGNVAAVIAHAFVAGLAAASKCDLPAAAFDNVCRDVPLSSEELAAVLNAIAANAAAFYEADRAPSLSGTMAAMVRASNLPAGLRDKLTGQADEEKVPGPMFYDAAGEDLEMREPVAAE